MSKYSEIEYRLKQLSRKINCKIKFVDELPESGVGCSLYVNKTTGEIYFWDGEEFVANEATETLTTLSINANTLTYVDEEGDETNIDLSLYLDDTNLARITSGVVDSTTGIATFTRDDDTPLEVDFSSLIDQIELNEVDNTLLSDVPEGTIKGRVSAGVGDPEDLTPTQVRTLLNVEDGATGDQTASEIKAAYESNADTNAFTDAEKANLANQSGINTGDQDLSSYETTTQLDARDVANRDRNNHTGTQPSSTISDFDTEVSNNTDVSANTADRHTHTNKAVLDATEESYTTADKNLLLSALQNETITSISINSNTITYIDENGAGTDLVLPPDTQVTVENVLTSTSTDNALSANQGKVLQDNKEDITTFNTGSTITFERNKQYGTRVAPITANLTLDTANARLGSVVNIWYNNATALPAFVNHWLSGSDVLFTTGDTVLLTLSYHQGGDIIGIVNT